MPLLLRRIRKKKEPQLLLRRLMLLLQKPELRLPYWVLLQTPELLRTPREIQTLVGSRRREQLRILQKLSLEWLPQSPGQRHWSPRRRLLLQSEQGSQR